MRQHRRQHMVVPAGMFAHFIMGHPKLRFAFFKALLDCPTQATQPDKGAQGGTRWRITDVIRIAQFIGVCSSSILADTLVISSPFQSPLYAKRRASWMPTCSHGLQF